MGSADYASSFGQGQPAPFSTSPVRSETWTDNLERMREERLAHVKELIEVGLGQACGHYNQSNISVRHVSDHLVITWEADGKYGQAWQAWSDQTVRDAYAKMIGRKQAAFAADEKLRAAQSDEYDARLSLSWFARVWEKNRKEGKSRQAWDAYYESQRAFEAEYERKFRAALKSEDRLTFEIWLTFNVNGGPPQNLPHPVAAAFGVLASHPVNHFLRVQRSNYPSGQMMGFPCRIPPPYPTDAAAARAVLDDIFLPIPRKHASKLNAIVRCAVIGLRVCAALAAFAAILALYVLCLCYYAEQRRETEENVLEALSHVAARLERVSGQQGRPAGDLNQAADALEAAARDVEGKIGDLDYQIRDLKSQLTLSFNGRGLDAPPCWGVGEYPDRRVRYLFTVELRENDAAPIRVTRVPNNDTDVIGRGPFAGTPIGTNYSSSFGATPFPVGEWISAKRFSVAIAAPVNQFYASLGTAKSCRHYVRLCDHAYRTKTAASYKALLASVEGTFYFYRPSESFCGRTEPLNKNN
ncbi:MAG: hypothetical protein GC190_07965 [Alphaproteobacteria bacterium]|nr:hypothetical protein [Alphaproteobacteria bacterium]